MIDLAVNDIYDVPNGLCRCCGTKLNEHLMPANNYVSVTTLKEAYDAYWNAHSRREQQAAYHEILLFGGKDGYPSEHQAWWRLPVVRWLRQLANWIEIK